MSAPATNVRPGAADDDRGDTVVALRRVERRGQRLGHAGPERVDGRVVDLDDEHVAVAMGAYELGHGQRTACELGSLQRKADVVLREAGHGRAGVDEVVEVGELAAAVEVGGALGAVQQRRHPAREALRPPGPAQPGVGVGVERGVAAGPIVRRRARAPGATRRRRPGSGPWRRSAARCARRRRPGTAGRTRIGSTTKLRMPVRPFCRIGPSFGSQPSCICRRARSSRQIRSSDQASSRSSGAHCR